MDQYDFPVPPHYYREMATPNSFAPPDLARIQQRSAYYYSLDGFALIDDREEKLQPNYLENKRQLFE